LYPLDCWLLGWFLALMDAATTWYALRILHLHEGNPAFRWAIGQFGLLGAIGLRIVAGCAALGALTLGVSIRLPHHQGLVRRTSWTLLVGGVVFWGAIALSNLAQIAWYQLRL
jgi:hypothetical protein